MPRDSATERDPATLLAVAGDAGAAPQRRTAAIHALRHRSDPGVLDVLGKAARSGEWAVSRAAVDALGETQSPDALAILVGVLTALPPYRDDDVGRALGRFGASAVTPLLALADQPIARDDRLAKLLHAIGTPALEPLIAAATTGPEPARPHAIAALGRIGGPRARDTLVALLRDERPDVAAAAAHALWTVADPTVLGPLLAASASAHAPVRAGAAHALGALPDPRATARLLALLDDDDGVVRRAATEGVLAHGDDGVPEALEQLPRMTPRARAELAWLLTQLEFASPRLVEPALTYEDPAIRRAAVWALRGSGFGAEPDRVEETLAPLVRALRSDADADVRAAAAEMLGALAHATSESGAADTVDALLSALGDPDVRVRRRAALALAGGGDGFSRRAPPARYVGGVAGGFSPGADAVAALGEVLTRPNDPARAAAARALARVASVQSVDLVVDALRHPATGVRLASMSAIHEVLGPSGASASGAWRSESVARDVARGLVACLEFDDRFVRANARSLLAALHERHVEWRAASEPDTFDDGDGPPRKPALVLAAADARAVRAAVREPETRPGARFADLTLFPDGAAAPLPNGTALQVDTWYELEVAVRGTPTGVPRATDADARPIVEPGHTEDATLTVTAEGDGFEVEEPVSSLVLPPHGDSTQHARFRVKPTRGSRAREDADGAQLRVRLYYDFNLLESVVLSARVVGRFDDAAPARRAARAPITVSSRRADDAYVDLAHTEPRAMHIDVEGSGDEFRATITFFDATSREVKFVAPVRVARTDLEDELVAARDLWYAATFNTASDGTLSEAQFADHTRAMARVGRALWTKLFKRQRKSAMFEVAKWLEAHPLADGSVVQITLREGAQRFVLPWALLYDRPLPKKPYLPIDVQGFWGVRYCIEQRALQGAADTPVTVDGALRLDVSFWEQFRNIAAQRTLLENLQAHSAGRLAVSEPPITDVTRCYEALDECRAQVLYFYTHGYTRRRRTDASLGGHVEAFLRQYDGLPADAPARAEFRALRDSLTSASFEANSSWIELTYGKLYLDELYSEVLALDSRPLVVLNMCESAVTTPTLSESFVDFFLDRGARGVIGTECPMTIDFAHPFSEQLLGDVLSGAPVGPALLRARRHFMARRNPLGLAYTHFGPAMLRFVPPCFAAAPSAPAAPAPSPGATHA